LDRAAAPTSARDCSLKSCTQLWSNHVVVENPARRDSIYCDHGVSERE